MMVVLKFGGTSVTDADALLEIARAAPIDAPLARSSFAFIVDPGDAHGLVTRLHDHFLPPSPAPSTGLRRDERDREQQVAV